MAELLIVALIIGAFAWIIWFVRRLVQKKDQRQETVAGFVATLSAGIGILYCLFMLTCGLNYVRPGFAALHGIQTPLSSVEELELLTQQLACDVNALSSSVALEHGAMRHSAASYYQLSDQASVEFSKLGEKYSSLGGFTPPTKPVLLSYAMSYAEITGVYFPFTFECNVNVHHPDMGIPYTMMHELAHSKGFMQENEANFIAYLACENSNNPDFQYSGALMGFIFAGNALAKQNKESYLAIREQLSPIAQQDLAANSEYWALFKTPIATMSSAINNAYLKANRQTEGVKSYGQVVDLLLAHFREQGRLEVA